MRQRLSRLLALAGMFLLVFGMAKLVFLAYNIGEEPVSLADVWQVWSHGLGMDLSATGYLIAIPWLVLGISLWWRDMPLRRILTLYYIIIGIGLSAILVGDVVMYPFWKFKLDATVFSYMGDTQGATNSVSLGFIVVRLLAFVVVAVAIIVGARKLTPVRIGDSLSKGKAFLLSLAWILVGGVTFLFIRGGWQESVMNVGVAYFSPRLYLNHAAVNPAFSLMSSLDKQKDFSKQFQLGDAAEAEALCDSLYAPTDSLFTDTLLRSQRPNLLVVLIESYGGQFVEELGGLPDVSPNLSRLIPQGVWWSNMWANSFRTDRGTVSAFSGWVSYPNASLMRIPGRSAGLPSIARSLKRQGYSTHYLYGGDIKIMGKSGYLVATGYDHLISDKDFSAHDVNESKWGANDSVTAMRALQEVRQLNKSGQPWHFVLQTLSSHEPYEVPYQRLSDPVQNAFAFTDHCIGMLVDSLRQEPEWENTLVVLIPDHGSTYQTSYENPEFFHCPLLWLGGAVKQPRKMDVLMNQSDIAATLLAQMGIGHSEFPWSRNVLSPRYTHPFVYCTYPGGILLHDTTGTTIWDVNSHTVIYDQPLPSADRLRQAQSILQTSYRRLGTMKKL